MILVCLLMYLRFPWPCIDNPDITFRIKRKMTYVILSLMQHILRPLKRYCLSASIQPPYKNKTHLDCLDLGKSSWSVLLDWVVSASYFKTRLEIPTPVSHMLFSPFIQHTSMGLMLKLLQTETHRTRNNSSLYLVKYLHY